MNALSNTDEEKKIVDDMMLYGRLCVANGLIYGNYGNMSVKRGGKIYITRSGCMLGNFCCEDIVSFVDMIPEEASSDTPIHTSLYNNVENGAVLHMHGDFTIVLSLLYAKIEPCDFVGKKFLGTVPVVDGEFGTPALNNLVATSIVNNSVIVKGHGSFTIANTIRKAFVLSCALEASCKLLYYYNNYKKEKNVTEE